MMLALILLQFVSVTGNTVIQHIFDRQSTLNNLEAQETPASINQVRSKLICASLCSRDDICAAVTFQDGQCSIYRSSLLTSGKARPGARTLIKKQGKPVHACSDVKKVDPNAGDGEYWIHTDAPSFIGYPSKIFCHNMNSGSPQEFVTLPFTKTAVFPQLTNQYCMQETTVMSGNGIQNVGTTHFSKIRVNITTMAIVRDDFTFTSGTGTKRRYGEAKDCYTEYSESRSCTPKGTFNINTAGTGMIIDKKHEWEITNWKPFPPSVSRSADGTQIDLLCGGYCGGCGPVGGILLLQPNPNESK
ncbi:A disintegrin and metalloproteinase with thrombospondin motifs 9-like [Haliotis rufescens]|uniref:A disintegrin and metalloproteinase with thrombospondin motifs 9-like n=1 Tax=Haliotis rufescens TaxID=6454 RepID=UPI00201F5445|nr:A disintegrin and metalloproteinase with thrombospondin motifs 9-like [Haliotis rufescens]